MRRSALALLLLSLVGCGPPEPVRAALHEDLAALRRAIARASSQGELDEDAVVELARAVASREVASARGLSGIRRVRSLRACALPLIDVLRARSEQGDDVAAEAMLVRLVQHDVDARELMAEHHAAPEAAWRAVAARAAIGKADFTLRRRWFEDPDERVRRAALEAASIRAEPGDLAELLEVFRLDPDPLSRSLAARAIGRIGGEAAVLGLKDRFGRADEYDRLAAVSAWSSPASFRAGGERELRLVASGERGIAALSAASALLGHSPDDGAMLALLVTAIRAGSEQEQRLALSVVPTAKEPALAAITAAANDPNVAVRVIALSRLLAVPAQRPRAIAGLRQLASREDSAAVEARAALAEEGDTSVANALARDLARGEPWLRQRAALALVQLGAVARAATALGDSDPGVRTAVSCGVLAARAR